MKLEHLVYRTKENWKWTIRYAARLVPVRRPS